MIPMSCPSCGSQGEVPLDRLNSRLKCKKCGAIFYMDQTGSIILGDPNSPTKKGRRKAASKRDEYGPGIDLDFGQMIRDIPKPVRIGALVLLVVAALGYGVSSLVGSFGTPTDIEGRSALVAEYFVDNKVEELQGLATSGTADDMVKWHQEMRPKFNYDGPRQSRGDVATAGALMTESGTTAWSFATLAVVRASPAPAASPGSDDEVPQNTMSLTIYWNLEDGQWMIDGAKTLEEALKPPAPVRGSRGGRN